MVEFLRVTYDPLRRRGVAQRTDVCRSAEGLAVRRRFTPAEDTQFIAGWTPYQERIDATTRQASAAARAQCPSQIFSSH